MIRFACHPPIAGHTSNRRYSADFPGFVRRYLQEKWGGQHAYLTGPCGNIMPWEHGDWQDLERTDHVASGPPLGPFVDEDGSFHELQRIAREIVEALDAHKPKADAFEKLHAMDFDLQYFDLALRDDFLLDEDKREQEKKEIWDRLAANSDLSFADYKTLADRFTFLNYHDFFKARGCLDQDVVEKGSVQINIPAFRLNNIILQGTPGESFWEIPQAAQDQVQEKGYQFVSFSFANGSTTYLPTDDERPNGDYETCYCIAGEGAVTALSQQLLQGSEHLIERAALIEDAK
ncbi:MAG: hypothetical protein HRU15_00430 [Planctomycetes bacterium]|nr:hypothetical protein [Planctomycetota bacterium]